MIILRNGGFILNWKENKEAGAICFEIRIPRKKARNNYSKSHQTFMEVIYYRKKQKHFPVC